MSLKPYNDFYGRRGMLTEMKACLRCLLCGPFVGFNFQKNYLNAAQHDNEVLKYPYIKR